MRPGGSVSFAAERSGKPEPVVRADNKEGSLHCHTLTSKRGAMVPESVLSHASSAELNINTEHTINPHPHAQKKKPTL